MTDDMTTIPLKKDTRDLLKEVGKKSETYDEVILRLIRMLEKNGLIVIENEKGKINER